MAIALAPRQRRRWWAAAQCGGGGGIAAGGGGFAAASANVGAPPDGPGFAAAARWYCGSRECLGRHRWCSRAAAHREGASGSGVHKVFDDGGPTEREEAAQSWAGWAVS